MTEFWRSTALPHLEGRRSCHENPCYRPHTHDSFSIGAIDVGTSVLTGPLEGRTRLKPGDVIVIPSGQVHACNPDQGRWLYQMIHADQAWAARLASGGEMSELFDGIRVLHSPDLRAQVSAVNDAIFADAAADTLQARYEALLDALDDAAPELLAASEPGTASETDAGLLARLETVMHRLRAEEKNPALDELAASVDMSKYQLIRAMRRVTGLSPLAWRQNARVVTARRMLREGCSIAETAHALGFTDQSHFHRVFRAHVAASPGTYRS